MKKIWKIRTSRVSGDLNTALLASRGAFGHEAAATFLDPSYEQSIDPFLLADMDKAVGRVSQALQEGQKITVYADYDADAVSAAAVLLRFFKRIGFKNWDYYIPDRYSEGYGMNPQAITALAEKGTNLIVTVDCGVNSLEPIKFAKSLGIDVVVTDHHQLTGPLPEAVAVVNPHRPDDPYPFKDLTGVGVAFKLVQALLRAKSYNLTPGFEKWLLDLVAIGTVADCTSLLGENRIFVKWGLHVLQKTRSQGLKKLMEKAGIAGSEMDTYKVGFIVAPRLNAAGRIEHANLALELLLTDDEVRAEELASELDELNRKRQQLTQRILSEAREQLLQSGDKRILLAASENWPRGIVGLVAGKLTEEFSKPVLILEKGDLEAVGSARSVTGFNIVEAISQSSEILVKYGGHPMAAGFTIRSEHIEIFHQQLVQYAETNLDVENLSPILEYDAEISLSQISEEFVSFLEKLAPFGLGNPRPRFRINNSNLKSFSKIGEAGKHLRLNLGNFGCIGFSLGFWADKLQNSQAIDIICEPQWNEWNGRRSVQLKIIDLDFSKNAQ